MRLAGHKNHREVVLKHVSEVVRCIKTLWERSMTIWGKSNFEHFSTPENFPGSGNFDPPPLASTPRLCGEHEACGTERTSRDRVKTCFRGRGKHKNTMGMLSFHFVKIDFRKNRPPPPPKKKMFESGFSKIFELRGSPNRRITLISISEK